MQRVSILRHVVTATRRASTARKPPPLPKSKVPPKAADSSRLVPKSRPPPPPQAIDPSQPLPELPSQVIADQTSGKSSTNGVNRGRAVPGVLLAITTLLMGLYAGSIGVAAIQPCTNPDIAGLSAQKDVAARYDTTASDFDGDVEISEILMGINRQRKKLARKCRGDVLEVSCGTGRNLGYYDILNKDDGDEGVKSLTFVDLSPQMIDMCKKKWEAHYGSPSKKAQLRSGLTVRFLTGSALDDMPLAPSDTPGKGKKYDAIIQTMGLCSTPSPGDLLTNMVRHLDTTNPEARILLLEHGRSYLPWLNRILDNNAEKHAEIHGCWFNREIGELVEAAAQEHGLEVVNERRHHLGTTWMFELRPTREVVDKAKAGTTSTPVSMPAAGGSWTSWLGWK